MDGADETDNDASDASADDEAVADAAASEQYEPTVEDDDEQADDDINTSVHDMIALIETEIERLKASLEVYRQSDRADRRELIRQHVQALDERQDALDDLQRLVATRHSERNPPPDILH